jgi:hypothetical protein
MAQRWFWKNIYLNKVWPQLSVEISWKRQLTQQIKLRQVYLWLRQYLWLLLIQRKETSHLSWSKSYTHPEETMSSKTKLSWTHRSPKTSNIKIQNLWLGMAATSKNGQKFNHLRNPLFSQKFQSWVKDPLRFLEKQHKLAQMLLH